MSDCCSTSCEIDIKKPAICKSCGEESKKVDSLAVKSLLKEGKLHDFEPVAQYFYCKTRGCETVYFTDGSDTVFTTRDIKTEIAQKSKNREGYVCFCFAHTVKEIGEEVKAKGENHISKSISKECKLKKDACEVKNPRGKCCISDVKKIEKEAMAKLESHITAAASP